MGCVGGLIFGGGDQLHCKLATCSLSVSKACFREASTVGRLKDPARQEERKRLNVMNRHMSYSLNSSRGLYRGLIIWLVVKIMVPFWVPIMIRPLIFRGPKKGP